MKIHRTLFVRKNLPILAVLLGLLGFWGIGFDSVKQVILDLMPRPSAGEPFFCALKDEDVIWNAQGDPKISSEKPFLHGGCSTGFVSRADDDRVTFPVPDWFADPKAGTIELCLTPQEKFFTDTPKNLCLFYTEPSSTHAIKLEIVYPKPRGDLKYPPILRLRVKSGGGPKNGRLQAIVKWEKGQHYHIACTWGKKGPSLYIDGKRVNHDANYKRAPENLSGRFVVNNASTDPDDCDRPTHCIISNLVIHDAQLNPEDLGKKCPIRDHWHPEK